MEKPEFGEIVDPNFEYLIEQLSQANATVKGQRYFDFMTTFINRNYQNFTVGNTEVFMKSLVERVLVELKIIDERRQKFQQEFEAAKQGGKTLDLSKKNKGRPTQTSKQLQAPAKRLKKSHLVQ